MRTEFNYRLDEGECFKMYRALCKNKTYKEAKKWGSFKNYVIEWKNSVPAHEKDNAKHYLVNSLRIAKQKVEAKASVTTFSIAIISIAISIITLLISIGLHLYDTSVAGLLSDDGESVLIVPNDDFEKYNPIIGKVSMKIIPDKDISYPVWVKGKENPPQEEIKILKQSGIKDMSSEKYMYTQLMKQHEKLMNNIVVLFIIFSAIMLAILWYSLWKKPIIRMAFYEDLLSVFVEQQEEKT